MFCQLSAHHIGEEKVQVRAQVEVVIIISEALGVHAYLIVGFESEVHLHHPLSAPAHHFVCRKKQQHKPYNLKTQMCYKPPGCNAAVFRTI